MPRNSLLSRSRLVRDAYSIATAPWLDFLAPAVHAKPRPGSNHRTLHNDRALESAFFTSLQKASSCPNHKPARCSRPRRAPLSTASRQRQSPPRSRYTEDGRLIIETTNPKQPQRSYEETHAHFEIKERNFAKSTKLPPSFFTDINAIRQIIPPRDLSSTRRRQPVPEHSADPEHTTQSPTPPDVHEQFKLMESIRNLEAKLAKAKRDLDNATAKVKAGISAPDPDRKPVILTKQDYKNLVDLYFYSHNSRFSPENSDASPTPTFLTDYSFELSSKFSQPFASDDASLDEEGYVSPLEAIGRMLKENQLREIAVMRVFVDLLLDEKSSNRALYEAYQEFPTPGVSYLPKGVLRLFLQRMSVPWVKSQAPMLRYLSLIDDMQKAKLPITVSEWSSAIYLAGRSFNRVQNGDVTRAFAVWRQMETDAKVKVSHVTFNILFDIAVRAGRFALGETILAEMNQRNLRLNRLGRVSLIYYHGLRGDGDGVRKAYHDFVEAGEIVDTLVLNCVIASLINAQEPTAAEQVYQRMKDAHATLQKGYTPGGSQALFKLHPMPGGDTIANEMASNALGRILARAPHLKTTLPEHHTELQNVMPLTPDATTFRILMSYHVNTSGNLNSLTVLLNDMFSNFNLPLEPLAFQLLFKGFALHGPRRGPDSPWTRDRLDMIWRSCKDAITLGHRLSSGSGTHEELTLPTLKELEQNNFWKRVPPAADPQPQRAPLSLWEELVVDLAVFPRERLKRVQRTHAEQFGEQVRTNEGPSFYSPFFQEPTYEAPEEELDQREGEYTLPNPVNSTLVNPFHEPAQQNELPYSSDADVDMRPEPMQKHDKFFASKQMICWLLRAYSRVTNNRQQVEEIWNSARKVWKPEFQDEVDSAARVFRRCLEDCDRMGNRL